MPFIYPIAGNYGLEFSTEDVEVLCTDPFCTVAEAKSEIGIATIDTSHDVLIANFICDVSAAIRDICGWYITLQDYSAIEFYGNGAGRYNFPEQSVTALLTIEIETGLNSWIALPAGSYRLRRKGNTNVYEAVVAGGLIDGANYRISYTAGYVDTPRPIRRVTIESVRELYMQLSVEDGGKDAFRIDSVTRPNTGTVPTVVKFLTSNDRWMGLLSPYRLVI